MTAVSPQALVVGPMKAGTTWIHKYLESRGDVCLPKGTKETFYFDRYFNKRIAWYEAHFQHYVPGKHLTVVEVAPSYFASDAARLRIQSLRSLSTLIVCIREPVARSWSHYLHMRRYGYTRGTLKDAIRSHPEIVDASRYSKHMGAWRDSFPMCKFGVLALDLLKREPEIFTQQLCEQLELPFFAVSGELTAPANVAAVPPSAVLASLARRAGRLAREYRLYSVVEWSKRWGFHKLAYGQSANQNLAPSPSAQEEKLLTSLLRSEQIFYDQLIGEMARPHVARSR